MDYLTEWWVTKETQVACPDCGEKSPYLSSVGLMQQWVEAHVGNCRDRKE